MTRLGGFSIRLRTACENQMGQIVRAHAGGAQEMCWHLFTWGTDVSIVAPHALRSTMAEMAAEIAQQHAKPSVPTS